MHHMGTACSFGALHEVASRPGQLSPATGTQAQAAAQAAEQAGLVTPPLSPAHSAATTGSVSHKSLAPPPVPEVKMEAACASPPARRSSPPPDSVSISSPDDSGASAELPLLSPAAAGARRSKPGRAPVLAPGQVPWPPQDPYPSRRETVHAVYEQNRANAAEAHRAQAWLSGKEQGASSGNEQPAHSQVCPAVLCWPVTCVCA